MVFVLVFLLSWTLFFCLFQRQRFGEILPTSLLAMVLGLTSDVITDFIPAWTYHDEPFPLLAIKLLDDYGLYFVVSYLYIQSLPSTRKKWWVYTFLWTLACALFETLLLHSGHMTHHLGWSLWVSYFADWVILSLLTQVHKWYHRKGVPSGASPTLNELGEVVCYKDGEGRWIVGNEGIKTLFHLHGVPHIGKTDLELAEANTVFREAFRSCWETDQKTWEAGIPCTFTDVVPQPDGRTLTFDVTKIPTFDETGGRKGLLVLAHPRTDSVAQDEPKEMMQRERVFQYRAGVLHHLS